MSQRGLFLFGTIFIIKANMTVLRSQQFDDVYFSVDDGMAETNHVFLNGNDLPNAWQGCDVFTIAETGFGTGLNFLCAWKLFEETAEPTQRIYFISVEKYPLSKNQIREALSPWQNELGNYIDCYLSLYPIRVPGPHQIHVNDRVTLTLWIGDIVDVIPQWIGQVDAWFLDGFTPAKNPDMWSDVLFENMARLSHSQTTFATFTAAGFVKRGLEGAGFTVEKVKGFGRKRDMMRGRFNRKDSPSELKNDNISSIAIVGGGLAGCAMAYMANRYGIKATIYETGDSLASGASGGKLGMINPKLTAKASPQADYYTAAYANALRMLSQMDDVDFNIHGSMHLCTDEDKDRRFSGYIDSLGWHADHIQRVGEDLYYPDGAGVSPEKLCHKLAENADIHLNHKVESLSDIDADIIVLANGYSVNELLNGNDLPLSSVRGQVSWVKPQADIDSNICFGGYITPKTPDGFHVLGASFQPWDTAVDIRQDDHEDNLKKYNEVLNKNLNMNDVIGGWAALRTASKDRFPIIGHAQDNVYISTAHGSHGIISSLYGAQIVMAKILDHHLPVSGTVLRALSPQRFHKSGK